ncbi:HAD-IIIC family phosphatase [Novacetimonas hansenii]|uniref:HAD-IIIC family phosphatase n=1 Tax=Novacetimonas hansenii TaxID=436 RepID=UPI00094FF1BA|nr:HAD-IIIC family phosphatase [Novacetimonas hansenii]
MSEEIRLVIWDLDETFWHGTLTEGGISYSDEHHNIVVELAKRGIMSSICSKNDPDSVQRILQEKGIWDYFVFPSIDWSPKVGRVSEIIRRIQLRPETVLFIDDNPHNLQEVLSVNPAIQVTDEHVIPRLLVDARMMGKDDTVLSRLKHYKILESRDEEKETFSTIEGFLKESNIKVEIIYDVENHLDRAIELINRTNQLNFTKQRLPENQQEARDILLSQIKQAFRYSGLVRVSDKFGDYGIVGFYSLVSVNRISYFEHFCFSCRILGMGIEQWVYQSLDRPDLHVQGKVISDVNSPAHIDWINQEGRDAATETTTHKKSIYIRGGCHAAGLAHYLKQGRNHVVEEQNFCRDGVGIRIDHSQLFRDAIYGLTDERLEWISQLGYRREDFKTQFNDMTFDVYVLNFSVDALYATYSYQDNVIRYPFPECRSIMTENFSREEYHDQNKFLDDIFRNAASGDFHYHSPDPSYFENCLKDILSRIPEGAFLFILLGGEKFLNRENELETVLTHIPFNQKIIELITQRKKSFPLQLDDYVRDKSDQTDREHFGRMVYYRIYKAITDIVSSGTTPTPKSTHDAQPATVMLHEA